jgi:Domain of unknown function (DUF3291)
MTEGRHLAQFNIARISFPLDDPRMAEFVDNVARVNALAEQIDGFVWRLQDESGHAMNMMVYGDPRVLPNLTVWENVEALERFAWQTVHGRFYRRRAEWFEPIETPLVLWWVPAGHRPTLEEGVARLEHMKKHGPSEYAFDWEGTAAARLWKAARGKRPTEQGDVLGKQEPEVPRLQVLVADRGGRRQRAEPRAFDLRTMPAARTADLDRGNARPQPALSGVGEYKAG